MQLNKKSLIFIVIDYFIIQAVLKIKSHIFSIVFISCAAFYNKWVPKSILGLTKIKTSLFFYN